MWRLQIERHKREQQAVVARELGAGPIPGATDGDASTRHTTLLGPAAFHLPVVGRAASRDLNSNLRAFVAETPGIDAVDVLTADDAELQVRFEVASTLARPIGEAGGDL